MQNVLSIDNLITSLKNKFVKVSGGRVQFVENLQFPNLRDLKIKLTNETLVWATYTPNSK